MPLISFCPECQTQHTLPDLLYGKNIQCKNCKKWFHAGQPQKGMNEGPPEDREAETATGVNAGAPKPVSAERTEVAKPRRRRQDEEDDEEEDRPRRKKEKSNVPLFLVLGGLGVGLVLIVGVGVIALVGMFFLRGEQKAVARLPKEIPLVEDRPPPPPILQDPWNNPPEILNPNPDPGKDPLNKIKLNPQPDPGKDAVKKFNPPVKQGPLFLMAGSEFQKLGPHGVSVLSVAITANGQRAIAGAGGVLAVWDVDSGKAVNKIMGPRTNAEALLVTSDGRRIFAVGRFGEWLVADLETGNKLFHNVTNKGSDRLAITPDGKQAVTQEGGVLTVFDLDRRIPLRRMPWLGGQFNKALAISPDGRRALLGGQDNTVRVFDLEKGQEIRSLAGHGNHITSVAFSADGRKGVSGSGDRTIKIWDLDNAQEVATCSGHAGAVDHVMFTADGRKVISGGDNTMRVWDAASGKALVVCVGGNRLTGIAASKDGRRLAASDYDQHIRIWQLPN